MTVQYIPDYIKDVVAEVDAVFAARAVDPFNVQFDFGHYAEVTRNLVSKDNSQSLKDKMYPLIWMVMDFEEHMFPKNHIYASVSLDFIIALPTSKDYTMSERRDKSFLPMLYPIYELFMQRLAKAYFIQGAPLKTIEHKKIDRPYWGGQDSVGNGTANMFNEFIDAIQLKGVQFNIKPKKDCIKPEFKTTLSN